MNPPQSLYWGYSGVTPTSTWASLPTAKASKRTLSESDDCDDVFSEESSKDQCSSPGDTDSCQMLSRKKRRGVIEKKRRDRINTSLTELKRLVPSAFEKQGSAKLEKAEILQMTVDHLKMIHAKGLDTLAYDPHKFAMDYHNIGFRECATEIARYLVTIEGMDIQDPLRLRIMSHLQCFVAQRELASKQAASVAPWPYPATQTSYPATPSTSLNTMPPGGHQTHQHSPPSLIHHNQHLDHHFDTSCAQLAPVATLSDSRGQNSGQVSSTSVLTPLTTATTTTAASAFGYAYGQNHNLNGFAPPPNGAPIGIHQNYNQGNLNAQMKPYRPWGGAEVAF